ncbi:intermembrane transport protein PqiB [Conchiformibius kuhniae]|uniref:Intermembrane transport protein PqiB n=1 Tax=Conchiformibius kuhniae TaxID=211502 RepID=A0ABD8B7X0_9NEIS|nr:intermembrane transport protein PqiB [Conchiformibius kuhniae]
MNKPQDELPAAKVRQTATLVSTVWLIPLLAAIVGAWLLAQNVRSKGPEITLLMDNAEGIEVNNTTIRILNVDVGRVTKIRLRPDQSGVEITARLNKDVEDLMRQDTQFWIVKPRIDQNGITGLNTLVSGAYIAFSPGESRQKASEFTVSELPPVTAIGQSGIRVYLSGKNSRMIGVGSPVLYENHVVGTVETANFHPQDQTVHYTVFINSPNESLLTNGSQFWLDNGISVRTDGTGISVQSPPLSALLSGAIAFHTPKYGDAGQKPAQSGDEFKIYDNRQELEREPGERTLYYTAFFKDSVRGLEAGAPVEYKGLKIGTVADVPYFEDGDNLQLFENGRIPVRLRLEPYLMESNGSRDTRQSKEYWQQQLQAAFKRGLSAEIASNNLILGSKMIILDDKPAPADELLRPAAAYHGYPVIATRNGGGLDALQAQVGKLLAKLEKLPLEQTLGGINANLAELQTTLKSAQKVMASADKAVQSADKTIGSAGKLVGSKAIQQMPAELNRTLQELRQTLKGVSPESPVYRDVQQTLQGIERTLKDVQPVIQTLKEQPNALIFQSGGDDPVPKGGR